MPSSRRNLNPGDSTVFTTRVAGQPPTKLFVVPLPFRPDPPLPAVIWHKELCCEGDHLVTSFEVVIPTAGELLTVRNVDPRETVQVFTDYI